MKTILIADDHSLIRLGLRTVIENMKVNAVIDEASDAESVMAAMEEKKYDLILLDIKMPATDSVALMHWIQSFHPATRILIVSQNPEEAYGKRYLQLGASGFINKAAPPGELAKAINRVLDGNKYLSDGLTQIMLDALASGGGKNPFDQLSQREFQVVMCLAKGHTLIEASEMLNVRYTTIHTHRRRAFEKLNIEDSKELNELASAYDLLD